MGTIRVALSPEGEDLFMFWPLFHGKLETQGLRFVQERVDTDALQAGAASGIADVIATSIARYASLTSEFLLLPHGAAVGRGYGPVIVSRSPMGFADLEGRRIGIPSIRTTAFLALCLLLRRFEAVPIPLTPFTLSVDAVRAGRVAAALLVHEGRLTFERDGLQKVVDLGEAWGEATGGLPLPLSGNVVRRGLGAELITLVSRLCRESVAWSLDHREEVMTALLAEESRADVGLDRPMLDRYLRMYANEDTRCFASDARRAVEELFARGTAAGLLPEGARVEFSG